mmetsp:Transcript_101684/g.283075  ORF Transcript_101684/g.283075 Transcript_101684/m.283075 type:complete len:499 (-) Transcript_101684:31-1527(-)
MQRAGAPNCTVELIAARFAASLLRITLGFAAVWGHGVAITAALAEDQGTPGVAGRPAGRASNPVKPSVWRRGTISLARETFLMQVHPGRLSTSKAALAEAGPSDACHTATAGEPCYSHVLWSMHQGILENASWYSGLAPSSSFADFQALLHQMGDYDCPQPCNGNIAGLDTVLQHGALVPANGKIRFYTIGSSNVVWETWPDQLHAMLKRLGYSLSYNSFDVAAMNQPLNVPVCDDASAYSDLYTPRVGKVGWSSWGFAFDSKDDCGEDGFRNIAGHNVSCVNGWACDPVGQTPETLVRPSEIAKEVQSMHVVLVSNWINDSRQHFAQNKCFGGEAIDSVATANITAASLRLLIRAIHAKNPKARVLVMARYPSAAGIHVNTGDLGRIAAINTAVEESVTATEPNTFFVNYAFPSGEEMFQTKSFGHPNCRGDKVMATAVLDALFRHKIIAKGLALGDTELCLGNRDCRSLSRSCCQRSALCYVAANTSCLAYGPGKQ